MRLLLGPPRSGKTRHCLDQLRAALRARQRNCRLLVPTATMAEHLRHTLAREGLVFSPTCIDTFGHFVDSLTPNVRQATSGVVGIFTGRYLDSLQSGFYAPVRALPGFRKMLAAAIESFAGAGGNQSHLDATHPAFADAFRSVVANVEASRYVLRATRLRLAAERLREGDKPPDAVWLVGFSGFAEPEIEVLRALASRTGDMVVTLSNSPVGQRTRELLEPIASETRRCTAKPETARSIRVACSTPENEGAEVARRILAEHERGRKLRDMIVVLRTQTTAAALRGAFARFAIPAHFHLGRPLAETAPVRFVNALADAAVSGWDWSATLSALRMHGSPLERSGDRWDYEVRSKVPGHGLATLRTLAPESAHKWLDALSALETSVSEERTAEQWARHFAQWATLFEQGLLRDGVSAEQIELWRNDASALANFGRCLDEAAGTFAAPSQTKLAEFRAALDTVVESETVWPRDRRSDVVHVVDAAEARQWRAPVVFVCGVVEDEFPKRVNEDPVLPDRDRLNLAQLGVFMPTSAQRQAEEHALFDTTGLIASEQTLFTWPVLSSHGDPLTRSFALARVSAGEEEMPALVRPYPRRARQPEPAGPVISPELLQHLAANYTRLSASKVESFVRCPWAFFAEKTLRLNKPPEDMWERLSIPEQGNIAHRAAELHFRDGLTADEALEAAFEEASTRLGVPVGYRTEAKRLELRHNIRSLLAAESARPQGETILYEHPFRFRIDDLEISGKMDRVDIDPSGRAVVFDYKYSGPTRLREMAKENEDADRVQGGLYLRAIREMGHEPAGLVWIGFKNKVDQRGWVLHGLRPDLPSCSPEHLEELSLKALETTQRVANDISAGVVAPAPSDEDNCERCDFVAVCRYEVGARKRATAVATGDASGATE